MRSRIGLMLTLLLSSNAAAFAAPAVSRPDLVRHGSFEEASNAGIGRDWASESYGAAKIRFSLDSEKAQAGKSCQRIQVEEYQNGGVQIRQLGIGLMKGEQYEITLWMRGNLSAPVTVGFRKALKPYTYYVKDSLKATSSWQQFTIRGVASEDDPQAGLYIFFAGNGDLWIDNVSAKAVEAGQSVASGAPAR